MAESESRIITCQREGCTASTDGVCLEGLDPESCDHGTVLESGDINRPDVDELVEPVEEPFLNIHQGEALQLDETKRITKSSLTRLIIFVKKNIIKIVMTFFFVKGKFILTLFLKKIALLSVTGLGKRYMIERVFMENFKIHFSVISKLNEFY